MSAEDDDGPGTREVAHRVFAAEFDDADYSHRDSDEERAPSYVITPSGAKANRLFLVGVLTEVEDVNEDMLRARIVDPTGAFVVYAGQYQPDARTFFERTEPPQFVAVSGKARTFEPDDGDRVFTSVRPEGVSSVDADTRDRWVVDAARQTLERVGAMATAIQAGADEDAAAAGLDPSGGIALALSHYGTTPGYLAALRDLSLDAARVVAGDRDEVRSLSADPDDPSPADLDELTALGGGSVEAMADTEVEAEAEPETGEPPEPQTGGDQESVEEATAAEESAEETEPEDPVTANAEGSAATEPGGSGGSEPDAGTGEAPGPETSETGGAGEAAEPETSEAAAGSGDELGDFEPGGLGASEGSEADAASAEEAPDVGDEMYELDEDERREIEEEYGAEFSTGTEVSDPGEADIETPSPEDLAEAEEETEPETEFEEETEPEEAPPETGTDEPGTGGEEAAADVDLDELVIERMRDLDEGDGADREELVAAVVDETGADPEAVEDAIQDALMGGQCYEPSDDRLKPI